GWARRPASAGSSPWPAPGNGPPAAEGPRPPAPPGARPCRAGAPAPASPSPGRIAGGTAAVRRSPSRRSWPTSFSVQELAGVEQGVAQRYERQVFRLRGRPLRIAEEGRLAVEQLGAGRQLGRAGPARQRQPERGADRLLTRGAGLARHAVGERFRLLGDEGVV